MYVTPAVLSLSTNNWLKCVIHKIKNYRDLKFTLVMYFIGY